MVRDRSVSSVHVNMSVCHVIYENMSTSIISSLVQAIECSLAIDSKSVAVSLWTAF